MPRVVVVAPEVDIPVPVQVCVCVCVCVQIIIAGESAGIYELRQSPQQNPSVNPSAPIKMPVGCAQGEKRELMCVASSTVKFFATSRTRTSGSVGLPEF